MKRSEHIKTAEQIGADSWVLLNYVELPRNASAARQIEALKRDQHWQENHHYEVSSRIDRLIADIDRFYLQRPASGASGSESH